jgi:hypothetical protein
MIDASLDLSLFGGIFYYLNFLVEEPLHFMLGEVRAARRERREEGETERRGAGGGGRWTTRIRRSPRMK